MAETANAGGGNSTDTQNAAGGAAQTEFKVPEGKVLLDAAEHQRFVQNSERVRGMQPYWETGSKYGLKKAEDLDKVGRFFQAATGRGVNLDHLIEAMSAKEEEQSEQSGGFDAAKFKKELGSEFISRADFEKLTAKQQAKFAHEQAQASEKALIEKTVSELLGDKANDWHRRSLRALLEEKRGSYPAGHPLADEALSPYDEKALTALLPDLKKQWAALTGQEIEAEADAAVKGKRVPTVAGQSDSSKTKTNTTDEPLIPGTPRHRAMVEAAAKQQDARRKGGTVSSLGG